MTNPNNNEQYTNENNEIISRLMQKEEKSPVETNDDISLSTSRVVSTRYKVLLLVWMFILVWLLQYLIFPAVEKQQGVQWNLQDIVRDMQNFETKRAEYIKLATILKTIIEQEQQLITCYNTNQGCDQLPEWVQNNLSLAIKYLQMQNLHSDVLVVDEKVILRNINDYLTVRDGMWDDGSARKNATINAITIDDPMLFQDNFYRVPVTVNLTATSKENVLSFLNNVETKIANNPANRVRYTIDQVIYDVANYDQEQSVEVTMSAFYLTK